MEPSLLELGCCEEFPKMEVKVAAREWRSGRSAFTLGSWRGRADSFPSLQPQKGMTFFYCGHYEIWKHISGLSIGEHWSNWTGWPLGCGAVTEESKRDTNDGIWRFGAKRERGSGALLGFCWEPLKDTGKKAGLLWRSFGDLLEALGKTGKTTVSFCSCVTGESLRHEQSNGSCGITLDQTARKCQNSTTFNLQKWQFYVAQHSN